MSSPNKEQVYDEQINPIVDQILEICKAHGIAMIASFHIPTPQEEDLCCSTMLPDENGKNGPGHQQAMNILRNGYSAVAMTATMSRKKD